MTWRLRWLAVAMVIAGLQTGGSAAAAQNSGLMQDAGMTSAPVTRVRVTYAPPSADRDGSAESEARGRGLERAVGAVGDVVDGRLELREESGSLRLIPIDSIRTLEVSLGRRAQTGHGALIGLAAGAIAGVVASLIICANGECDSGEGDWTPLIRLTFGVGGGVFGLGAGALTGSQLHTDRWESIPVQTLRRRAR